MDGTNYTMEEKPTALQQYQNGSMASTTAITGKEPGFLNYPTTNLRILKNVVAVSFGFLFLFTSFQSLSNLQSTLNKEDGLGTGGLSIVYGALVISCMFFAAFVVAHLGCKWTVAVSMICYVLYMAANFYAVWGLMAPASVIVGLGAAPLWSAKCTYLTQIAVWYSKLTGISEDAAINRFFGFFFMTFQTSQIWGNLISSQVFSQRTENSTAPSAEDLKSCGAKFDPTVSENNTNLARPDIDKVYMVCGIYLASAAIGFLVIVLFLDKVKLDKEKKDDDKKISPKLLIATFKHWWKSPYQKLLMPLTVYSGVEQAFIGADFTKSYVSCTLGIWNVGYVMICYGVVDAICSFTFGRLVQYVGHIPFFVLAFLVHGGTQIALLLWMPDPHKVYLFYIFAALWGMGDAVIQTQINALYGYLFSDNTEAAFANYRLWESIGFIIAFAYGNYLKTDIKIYIAFAWLTVGMALYAVVEFMFNRQNSALYGYLFTDNTEAGFANYRLWESVGFIIAFAYGNFLKTNIKLYIAMAWLVLGMFNYGVVEIMIRNARSSSHDLHKTKL